MNKFKRALVGIGLALLALYLVLPTISTASADFYPTTTSSPNHTAQDVAEGVSGFTALLTVYNVIHPNGLHHHH